MRPTLHARVVVRRSATFELGAELAIEPGRTTALLGPNGAGKTTVVSALAGTIPIDVGRITLGGRVLDDPAHGVFVPPAGRRVGVVFQGYLLFPHLSVEDNVAFGPRSAGLDRRRARVVASRWMERFDLADLAGVRANRLSGGEAQRVALARTMASEPEALLLDEPLAALDVGTRTRLRRALATHLEDFAGPRLLITHDPTEAFLLADFIYVLEHGTITQAGTADEIRLHPRTRYAADLVGANLYSGFAAAGVVEIGSHRLQVVDAEPAGAVLVTIHPRAVALHPRRPDGSPRNAWATEITLVEHLADRVRVQFERPLHLTAEVTEQSVQKLHLETGAVVWVAIKATEIEIAPDAEGPLRASGGHDLPV